MSLTGEETVQRNFAYEWASGGILPVVSVVLALIVGAFVVLASGSNPFNAYWQLFKGAVGSGYDITETLVAAVPYILAGLGIAFAFRTGLFNIGAQGQLYAGTIFSAWVGYTLNLSPWLLIPIALLAGAFAGAVWSGIAGALKAWRGAHEVITTMMLNFIALQLLRYLVESTPTGKPGPMQQHILAGNPETPPMNASLPVLLPNSWVPNNRLNLGLIIALVMAFLFWFILWRTTLGYKIRAVGLNPKAAAYAGINVGWTIVIAMLIAGTFAGLGGMVGLFGTEHQLSDQFSPSTGFDSIAVALLGRNTAIGVVLSGLLFGALEHGGALMQSSAGVSSRLVEVTQGLIIFFVAAEAIVRYLARRRVVRLPRWEREEAAA